MILALQVLHECVHVYVSKTRNIKIGLPLLLPSMEMGLFGMFLCVCVCEGLCVCLYIN